MASEVGHTKACINFNHDLPNVCSGHDQEGHERNIFLTGITPSFGAVHERSCGIIHNGIVHVELNAKSLELIGIAEVEMTSVGAAYQGRIQLFSWHEQVVQLGRGSWSCPHA